MEENLYQDIIDLKDIKSHAENANNAINNSNLELTTMEHNFLKEVSDYLSNVTNSLNFIIEKKEAYLDELESFQNAEEDTGAEE